MALKLASHTVMGAAMGLAFALVLSLVDKHSVMKLIDHSAGIVSTIVFVGALMLTFGIGATMTGLIFMLMEEDS
jgi:hypothetical protein